MWYNDTVISKQDMNNAIKNLENQITLDKCIENIQKVTRHYVKRQNT